MAESKANRSKAAKLKKRIAAGKPLSTEQRAWFDAYNKRTKKAVTSHAPTAQPFKPREQRLRDIIAETAARPDDELARQVGADVIHETERLDDRLPWEEATWKPVVPAAGDGEQPLPPGMPPPPAAGSPLVDDVQPQPAQPVGDPAAAAQFRGIVTLISFAGIQATIELSKDWPLPDVVRAELLDPEEQKKALAFIGDAAERVAVKYGFKSVPMADEAIVGGAVVGSALAWWTVHKRKSKDAKPQPPRDVTPPRVTEVDGPPKRTNEQPPTDAHLVALGALMED